MPNTWIFPIEHHSYLAHIKLIRSNGVISWILFSDENIKLMETGDEIYFWSFRSKSGIFGLAQLIDKPFKYPLRRSGNNLYPNLPDEEMPKWAYDEDVECVERTKYREYALRYRVGIKIKKLASDSEFIDNLLLTNDPVLNELQLINNWRTHFLLSNIQSEKIKVLWENVELISSEKSIKSDVDSEQGYLQDSVEKRAIEAHAVNIAKAHFTGKGFVVTETGKNNSYDLSCVKDGVERRVEVKGTKTKGVSIILTRAEVEHVRSKVTAVDLVLVSEINVEKSPNGPQTSGGNFRLIENWAPLDGDLTVKTYDYKIP